MRHMVMPSMYKQNTTFSIVLRDYECHCSTQWALKVSDCQIYLQVVVVLPTFFVVLHHLQVSADDSYHNFPWAVLRRCCGPIQSLSL